MSATAAADAITRRLLEFAGQFFAQGVVLDGSTQSAVRVQVGEEVRVCPALRFYAPTTGDVVWIGGPPGAWVCLGSFGAGTLLVSALRSLGNINADGAIGAGGNVVAGDGLLGTYVRTTSDHTRIGGFVSGVTGAGQAQLRAPDFDASLVAANGQLYVANAGNTVARNINAANVSERRLKVERGVVTGALAKVRGLVAGIWSWADPVERADDTVHVGVYVDELRELLPDAVRELPTGELGYEPNAVIGLLVAAVQELADEVDELRARVSGDATP